jgi:hypothetical protein
MLIKAGKWEPEAAAQLIVNAVGQLPAESAPCWGLERWKRVDVEQMPRHLEQQAREETQA